MDHELTITCRGRTFTIRAFEFEDGWTEAISEVLRENETAEWDGSGMAFRSANACLADAVRDILDTLDDDDYDSPGDAPGYNLPSYS